MTIFHPPPAWRLRSCSAPKQPPENKRAPNSSPASKPPSAAITETTLPVTCMSSSWIPDPIFSQRASPHPLPTHEIKKNSTQILQKLVSSLLQEPQKISTKTLLLTYIAGFPCMVFATTQTKTIEVGPGTQNPISVARFFTIPSKVGVQVLVQLKRTGTPGANFDVPVDIELRQPGAGGDADGPLIASRSGIRIGTTNTNINFTAVGNQNGCTGSPWKVRVKYLNDGREDNNFSVTGTTALVANDGERTADIEGGLITLNKGNSITKSVGNSSGFGQGNIKVTGIWSHSIAGVPGPLPIKLKFELLKPTGTIADSETAYKTEESLADPDLFFTYHVTSSTNGQWKLRITNNSDHDVMNIDPKIKFNPRCFD